jgi:uncharacterized membrane protein
MSRPHFARAISRTVSLLQLCCSSVAALLHLVCCSLSRAVSHSLSLYLIILVLLQLCCSSVAVCLVRYLTRYLCISLFSCGVASHGVTRSELFTAVSRTVSHSLSLYLIILMRCCFPRSHEIRAIHCASVF